MLVSLTEEKTSKMLVEKMDAGESFIGEDILLEFTNYELLHGILTCSLPISLLFPAFLRKRKTELCYKLALSEAALDTDGEYLRKSSRISYLDSAEKSMISYYLGNFFTFLITRKLFDTEYLLHLNYMRDGQGNAYDSAGKKKRQELIGYQKEQDAWSIWEAKGRSNNMKEAMEKGCSQAGEIGNVNGKSPVLKAVCMTYYERGYLNAKIQKESRQGDIGLDFSKEAYIREYYRSIRELFLEYYNCENMRDLRLCGIDFVELLLPVPYFLEGQSLQETERCICIGMPRNFIEREESPFWIQEHLEELKKELGESSYLGRDGIYVRKALDKKNELWPGEA